MRRAQMEMLGLALIIMLVSVALLFYIRFSVFEQQPQPKKQYVQSELASNFVSTLLQTSNPSCRGMTITQVLQDVAENQNVYSSCSAGLNTNQYMSLSIYSILEKTVKKWNIAYQLNISTDMGRVLFFNGTCKQGERTRKQFAIPINTGGSSLFVTMDICS